MFRYVYLTAKLEIGMMVNTAEDTWRGSVTEAVRVAHRQTACPHVRLFVGSVFQNMDPRNEQVWTCRHGVQW
jgi:hypothetical protein